MLNLDLTVNNINSSEEEDRSHIREEASYRSVGFDVILGLRSEAWRIISG